MKDTLGGYGGEQFYSKSSGVSGFVVIVLSSVASKQLPGTGNFVPVVRLKGLERQCRKSHPVAVGGGDPQKLKLFLRCRQVGSCWNVVLVQKASNCPVPLRYD